MTHELMNEKAAMMDEILKLLDSDSTDSPVMNIETMINPTGFVSNIRINGKPVLPPLLTPRIRDECNTYKHQAMLAESRLRAKKRDELLAKVQNIVDRTSSADTDRNDRENTGVNEDYTDSIDVNQSMDFDGGDLPKPSSSRLSSGLLRMSPGEVEPLTTSYIFSSSDSSEYQQTVIARDESSELKQVAKILRQEKNQPPADNVFDEKLPPAVTYNDAKTKLLDDASTRRPVTAPAATTDDKRDSLLGNVSLSPVSDKSRECSVSEDINDDISNDLISDSNTLLSTNSTDLMQYMKGSVSTMSSAGTLPTRDSILRDSDTIVGSDHENDHEVTVIHRRESTEQPSSEQPRSEKPPDTTQTQRSGKQEHLKRYLQHLSQQPQHVPITDGSSSQSSESSTYVTAPETQSLKTNPTSYSLNYDHSSELADEEFLRLQTQHFDEMRKRLEEQQREQLAQLLWEQQHEQYLLQLEMREQERRLKQAEEDLRQQSHDVVVPESQNMNTMRSDTVFLPNHEVRDFQHDQREYRTISHHHDIVIPEKALTDEMQVKFNKLTAVAKGFLTRRLLHSDKVQSLVKTVRDTAQFAITFQSETPIKRGIYSSQDVTLQERVIAQLRAALLEIHDIFFTIPIAHRMTYITKTRELEQEKRFREMDSRRSSTGGQSLTRRVSSATLKAMERKKRAKAAEEAMNGIYRPKTAPITSPTARSHNIDISAPVRRQFQYLFNRALKPIQGHHQKSNIGSTKPIKDDFNKSVANERPKTAPGKNASSLHQIPIYHKSKKSDSTTGQRKNVSAISSINVKKSKIVSNSSSTSTTGGRQQTRTKINNQR